MAEVEGGRSGGVRVDEDVEQAWWGVNEGGPAHGCSEWELDGVSEEGGVHGPGVDGEEGFIGWTVGSSGGACKGGEGERPSGQEGEGVVAVCGGWANPIGAGRLRPSEQ